MDNSLKTDTFSVSQYLSILLFPQVGGQIAEKLKSWCETRFSLKN